MGWDAGLATRDDSHNDARRARLKCGGREEQDAADVLSRRKGRAGRQPVIGPNLRPKVNCKIATENRFKQDSRSQVAWSALGNCSVRKN
jgi:hypothetical protein